MEAAVESTRLQIVAAGIEVRRLRAEAAASEEARAALDRLMHLKARFCELTGEEYRKKRTRGAPTSADAASSAHPRRQKQPKLVKEEAEQKKTDPMTLPPPADSFPSWSPRDFFSFEVIHRSKKPGSRARVCRITTPHGVILTPAFVPVGTNAALKALDERHGKEAGVQLMFCNTYHLLVHPGHEIIGKAGGLHRFMNHEGALITDSGKPVSIASPRHADYRGCFVCRDAKEAQEAGGASGGSLLRVSERGAVFRSYHDGRTIELTPESSVAAQKNLGADIIIPLDELPPYHVTPERLHASVRLSHRWMARSLRAHLDAPCQQVRATGREDDGSEPTRARALLPIHDEDV
ncbi:MAG: hypothetical protein SGPRY_002957 [Prymnesium sp.]